MRHDPFGLCALFSLSWVLKVFMMLPVLIAMAVAPRRSHFAMRGAEMGLAGAFGMESAR
jgi:hypothetical protein